MFSYPALCRVRTTPGPVTSFIAGRARVPRSALTSRHARPVLDLSEWGAQLAPAAHVRKLAGRGRRRRRERWRGKDAAARPNGTERIAFLTRKHAGVRDFAVDWPNSHGRPGRRRAVPLYLPRAALPRCMLVSRREEWGHKQ